MSNESALSAAGDAKGPRYVWREPVRGSYPPPGIMRLAGLERLRRWPAEGPLPPLTHLTGARPIAVGDGTAEATTPASPWLVNSAGVIGGGTLAILADIAFGCAAETRLPPATPYTTAELSLTFLRPTPIGAELHAHGQAIHVGGTIGLTEAFVLGPGDRLIAHGTSRLALLPKLEDVPELPEGTPQPSEGLRALEPMTSRPVASEPIDQSQWSARSGAEVLADQISGALPSPPLHYLTGLTLREAADGRAMMTLPASEWLASPTGLLQGGAIAMHADTTMQSAVVSIAPAGTAVAGLDLKVNYLRPGVADGRELTARAEVVHAGRTLAITRAEIRNADDKPIALATGSSIFLPGRPASLGEGEFPGAAGEAAPADSR